MELKIAFFIIVISVSNVFATPTYSQVAKVSLNMENKSLEQVMDEIESQSEFYFIFNQKQINVNRVVNIKEDNKLITDILPELFKGTNVNYAILDRKILLTTDPIENKLLAVASGTEPQQNRITGTVTDKNGPIPGVNVVVTGTTQGTITDIAGKYSIAVPQGAKSLTFSFIGMEPQEITIGTLTQINVTLAESAIGLEEVVVIGYGSVKKRDVTGSVASIKSEDISKSVLTSFQQGLQGRLAGVNMTQGDAAPGAGMSILIRGSNSFSTSSEPLYVVDGIPLGSAESGNLGAGDGNLNNISTTNIMATIPASDIESIEILKDASSTAIYGSRGSNGVVLITTKKGANAAGGQISLNYSSGFSNIIKKITVLNARQFAEYQNEAYRNSGLPEPWTTTTGATPEQIENEQGKGRDWQDEVMQLAHTNDYQLSFAQQNEKGSISILSNYYDEGGAIIGSKFRRGGLRLNIDNQINKWFNIAANVGATRSLNDLVKTTTSALDYGGILTRALTYRPFISDPQTGYESLSPEFETMFGGINPLRYCNEVTNSEVYTRIIGGLNSKITLPYNFGFETRFGANIMFRDNNSYYPRTTHEGFSVNGLAIVSGSEYFNLVLENLLTYNNTIGVHAINGVVGYTYENNVSEWMTTEVRNFPIDDFKTNNLSIGKDLIPTHNALSSNILLSYLGRINYVFNKKYLFTVTGRYDGSSKFALNKKWGFFPSAAFAWRLSEEDFIKSLNVFDNLKLRLSWGNSGNQALSPYQSLARLSLALLPVANTIQNDAYVSGLANPDLTWETTSQTDVGFDVGVINSRFRLTFDYYQKKTVDLLQQMTIPPSTGFNTTTINIGEVQNKGFEITLDANVLTKGLGWSTNFNFSTNKNEITDLGPMNEQFAPRLGASPSVQPFILRVGEPIGALYGFVEDGIFQTPEEATAYKSTQVDAQVGSIKYKDITGPDGVPDGIVNDKDRLIIGDVNPDYVLGWNNNFSWKNFNLSFLITDVQGADILNVLTYSLQNVSGGSNIPLEVYENLWRGEGTSNDYPQARTSPNGLKFSKRFIEDGSYIRLKNLELGYNVKLKQLNWLKNARIYVKSNNLLTFSKYSGYDPEVSTFSNDPSRKGVDYGSYPQVRTFTGGVNLTF